MDALAQRDEPHIAVSRAPFSENAINQWGDLGFRAFFRQMGDVTRVHAETRESAATGRPRECRFPEDLAPLTDELIE